MRPMMRPSAPLLALGAMAVAAAQPNASCVSSTVYKAGHENAGGKDIGNMACDSAPACAALCCERKSCTHFTFTAYQPAGPHQGQPRCWLKRGAEGFSPKANCTSASTPPHAGIAPPSPPPRSVWTPTLNYVKTIAFDPAGNMRDPSAMVQDPETGTWHFWVDHMNGTVEPGWHAFLHHYSAPQIEGPWTAHGLALPHSTDSKAWDYAGTFSPSTIYCKEEKRWYMFYSASAANQTKQKTCAQMVASSASPNGPWKRLLPAVAVPTGAPPKWQGTWNARRLDSGRALVIGGRKGYWTKGVSGTNVATEGLYLPHSADSWQPPYKETMHNPLFPSQSWAPAGYENCEFFRGPEGTSQLHVWCSWHEGHGEPGLPQGPAPHFIIDLKTDPLGINWTYTGSIDPNNVSDPGPDGGEPTPVYEGGPPGDNASVRYFIARCNTAKGTELGGQLGICLYKLAWLAPERA